MYTRALNVVFVDLKLLASPHVDAPWNHHYTGNYTNRVIVRVSDPFLCHANFSVLESAVTCTLGQGKISQPINFQLFLEFLS